MKSALWLVFGTLSVTLLGCSSSDSAAPGSGSDAAAGGSAGTGGKGGGGGGTPSTGGKTGTDGGKTDGSAGITVSGLVVDGSSSTGFDATKYTALGDVDVCVYGDSTIPCVKTSSTGNYTLAGAPASSTFMVSYKKTGFEPTLYSITSTTAAIDAPPIILPTTGETDSFSTDVGITRDSTKGSILFGAVTPGTKADSPYFEMFGTAGYIYVKGYQVVPTPGVTHGPFYVSEAWKPDKTLQESSAAGWGFMTAPPGKYTLAFSHPTLKCGTTTTTVVAGYDTTYVGTVCSPPADGGTDSGVADATPGDAAKDGAVPTDSGGGG